MDRIVIKGAREHNLKNISLELPRGKFIVITGVSGSGKSTLAFDTIYAEGQRRYVESLSSYARQFLGVMDKPDVEHIEGLSPAISIDQKTTSHNPRSTVGTVTEIHDYLRLLFARAGEAHCPVCDRKIERSSASEITDRLLEEPEGTKAILMAPLVRGRKGEYRKLFQQLLKEGYARVRLDGEIVRLEEAQARELNRYETHDIDLVVDRVTLTEEERGRIAESVELALLRGDGLLRVVFLREGGEEEQLFSEKFACPEHGAVLEELEPRIFSFNSPYGACEVCSGLGYSLEFDPELVVNPALSLAEGAIQPWAKGRGSQVSHMWDRARALAEHLGFDMKTPFKDLAPEHQQAVLYGLDEPFEVVFRRGGRETMRLEVTYEGVIPWLKRRYKEVESEGMRDWLEGYMSLNACTACGGTRYKPEVLAVKVAGLSIAEVSAMAVRDALAFFRELPEKLSEYQLQIARPILREVSARLGFLADVGLEYLSLDRAANTLSGGEAQRIRLATQVGSGLTGVLYVLDEPSIGLHPRDNQRLIGTLKKLRDLGNTLIVVEHDEETMHAADWMVDMGPGAGIHGGQVVAEGTPEQIAAHEGSLTGAYLRGEKHIPVPSERRKGAGKALIVRGAREHNLKNLDVEIPLGRFVVIAGPSGSGKSTLMHDILYAALSRQIMRSKAIPGRHDRIEGVEHLDKVIEIDQSPIGRTPRSNPATYTGVFDEIRDMFAKSPEARKRGYAPGRFSFNVKGGRCEACRGDGTVKIEMLFLPDIYVPCEVCKGRRYNKETLEVKLRGKTIADVLDMTVEEALEFFQHHPGIKRKLQLMMDVGLGYMKLGQPSPTLSGGEAQRIKLATELGRKATGKTLYILDEPTTGLHFDDVKKLLEVLHRLVDKGNSVLVIEHNLDVIKTADWILDLGPEGGQRGGYLVAAGTPEEVARHPDSPTGAFLRRIPEIAERIGVAAD
ncbi:excinuclease ABC subunit UvrA [Oceanithermus sp.]|uniref:excinuclease ABC subunit UvrA n=1 Tax=Oceanithermus sp. TaxID=2268145 RepID=UPI00257EE9C3|nr:excinuclease ABC subunit UvrA [Oceanithermus sp.]